MRRSQKGAATAAVMLGIGAVGTWWLWGGEVAPEGARPLAEAAEAVERPADGAPRFPVPRVDEEDLEQARERAGRDRRDEEAREGSPGARAAAKLRAAIVDAREERLRAAGFGGERQVGTRLPREGVDSPEAPGRIDPQYIRDAVREIRPLLAECYELAQAEAGREGFEVPAGRVVAEFVFAGEPDVGGVVEESRLLDGESEIGSPILDECFSETLYTLELPSPEEGGRVTVRYPFDLSPGDEPPTP